MTEFKTLKDLRCQLSDEAKCREYMEQMRWGGNVLCPHCGHNRPYKLKNGKSYRCRAITCKRTFTVTVKTVFENSKVSLATWIEALWVLTAHKKGISSHQLARDLGITQKTAWFVLHRLRHLMTDDDLEFDGTVEVDETYCGGKWANRNKYKRKLQHEGWIPDDKTPVMGFVQRGGKVGLKLIGNNDTFKDMVHAYVKKTAVVITDAHLGYRGLEETHAGHIAVNHSIGEYANGPYSTNTVEGLFSMLKRGIYGIYHHVSPKHLSRYCEEFAARYNTRKMSDKDRFVMAISKPEGRLKYKELIKKP